ncbi:hypothetical protein DXG01_007443 [Tephrocybe rancida]|nr:hypothetical protein DXG01_007443 [Tephrocybe rancida]
MWEGVAVRMRWRADSWVNATQILKVAGFDKAQRTWIPLERGLGVAKQYNCESLLRPIIEFQPAAKAHRWLRTMSVQPGQRGGLLLQRHPQMVNTRSPRRAPPGGADEETDHETLSVSGSDDGSMTPSPSEASSSSRTLSPIRSAALPYGSISHADDRHTAASKSRRIK